MLPRGGRRPVDRNPVIHPPHPMGKKIFPRPVAIALAFGTVLYHSSLLPAGAVVLYETGFERFEGYDPQTDLMGQSGWVGEGSGGNGILGEAIPGFSGQVAYLGYNPPLHRSSTLNLWHPLGLNPVSTDLPVIQFSVSLQIEDSTTAAPYFDDFRWSVYGTDGHRFFTLDFDNDARGIFYLLDETVSAETAFHDTHYSFSNGTPYDLTVTLNLARNLWSASINGAVVVNARKITTTAHPLSLGDVDAVWVVRNPDHPGDNFMIFDDYKIEVTPLTAIPAQLEFLGWTPVSGAFQVKVWGEPGVTYSLEATTDFHAWTPVAQGTASVTDGAVVLGDTDARNHPRRFYRASSKGL